MLLQPTHHHHCHHSLHALHPNRHRAPVNRILGCHVLTHAELGLEGRLVTGVLTVQEPSAAAESQHRVALAFDPDLIIRYNPGARHGVEEHLAAVSKRDGDDGRGGEGQQPISEEVPKDPGIFDGEGSEGERVALCLDGVEL